MKLQTFYSFYNLKELEIISLLGDGKTLVMGIKMPFHIDYIANGYRPSFDEDYVHFFLFENDTIINLTENIVIDDYKYEDKNLLLTVNNLNIVIKEQDVKINKTLKL